MISKQTPANLTELYFHFEDRLETFAIYNILKICMKIQN